MSRRGASLQLLDCSGADWQRWRGLPNPNGGGAIKSAASGRCLLNVVDEFTREALAVEAERTIDAEDTVATLKRIVAERGGAPENLRADNGPELTARALQQWCESELTATAYIEPGPPWQNPWVESFNARFRDEVLDIEEIANLAEAKFLAAEFRADYNANHHHSALGMMSPSRFAASWQRIGEATIPVNPELSDEVDR